jgi:hypothetical protein
MELRHPIFAKVGRINTWVTRTALEGPIPGLRHAPRDAARVKPEQPTNAASPRVVRVDGSTTRVNAEPPRKA